MTCMADGVYVVGDILNDLLNTFQELLSRARKAGLTFKLNKIVIASINTNVFGWKKVKNGWRPIEHTISPLTKVPEPQTA